MSLTGSLRHNSATNSSARRSLLLTSAQARLILLTSAQLVRSRRTSVGGVPLPENQYVDDLHVLQTVQGWLEAKGALVACAQNCDQAVQAVQAQSIDAAVVDYRLSGDNDGVRLGRVLRYSFNVRFVILSGYLTPEVAFAAARAGASSIVSKPSSPDQLVAGLQQALTKNSRFQGRP